MLLLAIPLCMNAQVKTPTEQEQKEKAKIEKQEKKKAEKEQREREKKEGKGGFEMPKISGFVQGMYLANLNDKGELMDNTLRMRRVRLSVDGTLFKGLTYKIQGDFARSPMLVDAYLKYKVADAFSIQLGQFKLPFSLESPINPVNLEIFDYGESVQKLCGYQDICGVNGIGRDVGLMATGSLFPVKGEEGIKYHVVEYALGVFNGNGPVTLENKGKDNNNRKDIVGRLEVHPGLKALTLSGSYYYGGYLFTLNDTVKGTVPRNRWSAGIQYNDGKLVIRGEYLNGTTGYYKPGYYDDHGNPIELYQFSKGYYVVAGYNFQIGEQKLMPVLRYEHFEPGDIPPTVNGSDDFYTVGINYWPLKSLNFKLDYSLIQHIEGEKTNSHRVVGILSYKF